MIRNKIAGLVIGITLLPVSTSAMTLQDAVREAIERNPDVQASWHSFLASQQDLRAASAGFRPTVDMNVRYGHEWRDYGPRDHFDGTDAELTLIQRLYDGFETRNDVARFSELQLVRYHTLISDVERTALEAYRAYMDVIRRRELVALAQDNVHRHREVFDQIIEGVTAGAVRTADLEQISGRLALAEANLITEQANLHDVTARFLRIVGRLPGRNLQRFDPDRDELPLSLQRVLERAYEQNPGFHAAIRNIHAAESTTEFRRAAMRPRLNLTARYGTQTYDDFGANNGRTDARVNLELSYNLYRGGRDRANIREAYQQVNVAKDLRDRECIDLRQTVQVAFHDIHAISQQLPALNQHWLSSSRVVVAYRDQFQIGQRSLLDVLDAENEAFQAHSAFINAEFDLGLAVARTMTATGDWLVHVGVVRDGLPTLQDLGARPLPVDGATACPAMTYAEIDSDGDGVPDYLDFCPNTPANHKVDDRGCTQFERHERVFDAKVTFASGSAQIDSLFYESLEDAAAFIVANPDAQVIIEGHASRTGSRMFNQALSEQRANAVAELLKSEFAVPAERLVTVGFGFDRPLVEGDTPEAHNANQRIEIRVTAEDSRAIMRE